MPNSEQRCYDRIDMQRKAFLSSLDRALSTITEDISVGGLRARWSGGLQSNVLTFLNGDAVDVSMEK